MTKKETIEMLKEMLAGLCKDSILRTWWIEQQINTLDSAIKLLKRSNK